MLTFHHTFNAQSTNPTNPPGLGDEFCAFLRAIVIASEGVEPEIYYDSREVPTIGYGYALLARAKDPNTGREGWVVADNWKRDFGTAGIVLADPEQFGRALQALANVMNGTNQNLTLDQAQRAVNNAGPANPIDGYQMQSLYESVRNRTVSGLENRIINRVNAITPGRGNELWASLLNSRELLALVDIAYNGGAGIVGPQLLNALATGNRAEAWYEIRCNSNEGGSRSPGIAKRRYLEAEFFGLYENPSQPPSLAEVNQIYAMLQNHRSEIERNENAFGVHFDNTNSTRNMIAEGNQNFAAILNNLGLVDQNRIPTINEAFTPAYNALWVELERLGIAATLSAQGLNQGSFRPVDVLAALDNGGTLDPSLARILNADTFAHADGRNRLIVGTHRNGALLYGNTGNDAVIGGSGNDRLEGGRGNDVLVGGEGYDTYIYRTGDGHDTIIDSDRKGRIVIEDSQGLFTVGPMFSDGQGRWKDPQGRVTLMQGPNSWVLLMSDGGSIDLGKNFNDGYLGITRREQQQLPQTTNEIVGDKKPVDPLEYDRSGNLVTNGPDPDRADTLFDTRDENGNIVNDHIIGGGGNDRIEARNGGDNILEGDAGADIVRGMVGNNWIYADTQIPLQDALAANDPGTPSGPSLWYWAGGQSDWIEGGSGNDVLIGSAAGDYIIPGAGNNTVVAGAGDDLILCPYTSSGAPQSNWWSVAYTIDENSLVEGLHLQ
ncbi:MAG: hypothetical protein FWD77_12090, partial [Betaproteobacteria bacterium]|nr:hypothetical protein [Betaproteobacteria bacterium]